MENPQKLTTQDEEKHVLDTTIYKQHTYEAKTNRTSFLCGNRNGHHNTELKDT